VEKDGSVMGGKEIRVLRRNKHFRKRGDEEKLKWNPNSFGRTCFFLSKRVNDRKSIKRNDISWSVS